MDSVTWYYGHGKSERQEIGYDAANTLEATWQMRRADTSKPTEVSVQIQGHDYNVNLVNFRAEAEQDGLPQELQKLRIDRIPKGQDAPYEIPKPQELSDLAAVDVEELNPSDGGYKFFWWTGQHHSQKADAFAILKAWKEYDAKDSRALATGYAAFLVDESQHTHKINGLYSVNFSRMVQYKTEDPYRERKIFIEHFPWFWDQNDGAAQVESWATYTPLQCMAIEQAYTTKLFSLDMRINNKDYVIEFPQMAQFERGSRLRRRNIKRQGTGLNGKTTYLIGDSSPVVISDTYPVYWQNQDGDFFHDLVEINPSTSTFKSIQKLMNKTIYKDGHDHNFGVIPGENRDPKYFKVVRLERIEAANMWASYSAEKARIAVKYDNKLMSLPSSKYIHNHKQKLLVPILDSKLNEVWAFHGATADVVEKIAEYGFNERMAKSASNMFLKQGLYFGENSSKSNQYVDCPNCGLGCIPRKLQGPCQCDPSEVKEPYKMILCRVVLGNPLICTDEAYRNVPWQLVDDGIPYEGQVYDSLFVESEEHQGVLRMREFGVQSRSFVYPEYVIHYERHLRAPLSQ